MSVIGRGRERERHICAYTERGRERFRSFRCPSLGRGPCCLKGMARGEVEKRALDFATFCRSEPSTLVALWCCMLNSMVARRLVLSTSAMMQQLQRAMQALCARVRGCGCACARVSGVSLVVCCVCVCVCLWVGCVCVCLPRCIPRHLRVWPTLRSRAAALPCPQVNL